MSNTIGLTPDEEALLSNMMGGNNDDEMPERRNLADIIMAKIEEKEAGVNMNQDGDEEEMMGMELPPKVVQVSSHTSAAVMCYICTSYTSVVNTGNFLFVVGLYRHWKTPHSLHIRQTTKGLQSDSFVAQLGRSSLPHTSRSMDSASDVCSNTYLCIESQPKDGSKIL